MIKVFKSFLSFVLTLAILFNFVAYGATADSGESRITEEDGELLASLTWATDFEQAQWESSGPAFSISGFEPGSQVIRYFKIENNGKLAFSYDMKMVATEMGELENVIDVYYKKDIDSNITVADMTKIGTLADVLGGMTITDGSIVPEGESASTAYTKETVVAVAFKMADNVPAEFMNKETGEFAIQLNLTSFDPANKFEAKFKNTDKYLYRVGNANAVALSSLFEAIDNAEIGNVNVSVRAIDENTNVSGTYTANSSDWKAGTIKFSGTGPVEVTIDDNGYTNEVSVRLEVVDAKNITKAESASSNNVVLLNDISGTFVVSNGRTFYGNGFTVTLPTASVKNKGNGFTGYISIGGAQDDGIASGGNLDNVKIIGPVYPEMYIYRQQAEITDSSDPDYGDGYNMRYFTNSVIVYGGNATISNSYISGSRTALCIRGGNNVVVENSTLSGGAYANMQISSGSTVTLRDVTTVQTDVPDSYGKGKNAHGLGIAVNSDVVDVKIEGELKQYNWLCQEQWNSIVPATYQSSFPKFFTDNTFSKYWHYLNGGTAPYVNMAFIA